MLLLVGLGNPGRAYAGHRHNVGFMAVDAIARLHGFPAFRARFQGQMSEGRLAGEKVLLFKPESYMNRSGHPVAEAARFFKLAPDDVVIFHDELDLAFGKVRLKTGGGHAGHNGLRSIDAQFDNATRRVRIGIGHPGDKAMVTGHVLGDFNSAEKADLPHLLDCLARPIDHLVAGDAPRYQSDVAACLGARPDTDTAPKQAANAPRKADSNRPATEKTVAEKKADGPMAAMLRSLRPGNRNKD
ncbi:aminoacyl-tRNA hydrolase [Yunchengibacter salinarum]|uniref:aminoacyl-tRNA hydrolase n=1 Tax=Yunchengibacter salinarum TaxID=3133399 RepID=UPI0035B67659